MPDNAPHVMWTNSVIQSAPCCCAAGLWPHRAAVVLPLRSSLRSPSPLSGANEAAGWPEDSHVEGWGQTLGAYSIQVMQNLVLSDSVQTLLTISLICVFSRASHTWESEYWSQGSKLVLMEKIRIVIFINWIKHDDDMKTTGTACCW